MLYLAMDYYNYNGKLLEGSKAFAGPSSRAIRYGDGLFETIKSANGELLFADDHFARLWDGLERLRFQLPVHFTPARLQQEILHLLQKNKQDKLARVRLTLFRGNGGLYDPVHLHPEYTIQTMALPETAGQWNSNGLVLGIYEAARKCRDAFSDIKHNNFLPYVMAALEAREQQWNDALLLNDAGRVCDSSIANVFLLKNGTVSTVSLAEGCIAGVMRKNLMRLLAEKGIPVTEAAITVEELLNADEVFLTNSIFNLRWVQRIGDKKYDCTDTRKIYAETLSTILP